MKYEVESVAINKSINVVIAGVYYDLKVNQLKVAEVPSKPL